MSRAYGPHRPEDAPATVLINTGGRRERRPLQRDVPVPVPKRLQRQREQLNTRAREDGRR